MPTAVGKATPCQEDTQASQPAAAAGEPVALAASDGAAVQSRAAAEGFNAPTLAKDHAKGQAP